MRFFDRQRYELRAWVVMPNHAHVVVWPMPGYTLSNILHSWKSFTSHKIGERLPKKVVPFWQSESYEHLIRDDEDLHRCCHYTLVNPVNARLCARIEDWPWSSAYVAQAAPLAQAAHVAQASPPASSSTVSVRGSETLGQPSAKSGDRDAKSGDRDAKSGGGTPTELAGGDACATSPPLRGSSS
jgi:REP element-mobilizing transposase RayT